MATFDDNNPATYGSYTFFEDTDFDNEPEFYVHDHLGNTRVVYTPIVGSSSISYTLSAAIDYFPYGKELRSYYNGTEERYLTTHHERDMETGLDYRGARFYDSDVARFLSLDPKAADYASWSAYNYVMSNPISLVDPDGKGPTPQKSYYEKYGEDIASAFKQAIGQQGRRDAAAWFERFEDSKRQDGESSWPKVDVQVDVPYNEVPAAIKVHYALIASLGDILNQPSFDMTDTDVNGSKINYKMTFFNSPVEGMNNITEVVQVGHSASSLEGGSAGWWLVLKGTNNRLIGTMMFASEKEFKAFYNKYGATEYDKYILESAEKIAPERQKDWKKHVDDRKEIEGY